MTRRSLSTRQRLAAFLAAHGRCQRCTLHITPGKRWEVDHITPVALGGTDDPANLQVLCAPCHGIKTAKRDAPQLAKAKRIQVRHLGAWRPAAPMRGSRASPWKRRLDGTVVKRQLAENRRAACRWVATKE